MAETELFHFDNSLYGLVRTSTDLPAARVILGPAQC